MEVLAYDIYPDPEYAVRAQIELRVARRALPPLRHHLAALPPLTDATRYMIDGAAIRQDETRASCSSIRAAVSLIHTEALIEGLKEKKIGAGRTDVYEEEAAYFYEDTSGPDHGRRRAGAPAVVQQCDRHLPSGLLYT